MRKLIVAGVPPIEAAAKALTFAPTAGALPAETVELQESTSDHELVEQLLRAAKALDRELMEAGLRAHLEKNNVEKTWENVMCPILTTARRAVEEDWQWDRGRAPHLGSNYQNPDLSSLTIAIASKSSTGIDCKYW
jgi:hypothetical protein